MNIIVQTPNADKKYLTYNGFLSKYDRMTARCEDLVILLGMETSGEGASKICRAMGIFVSGDTIIRMIKEYAREQEVPSCGETIGVDDFAYRKGHRYCTVVCDEASGRAVAVLEGRDGEKLKEWLAENKHVTKVTRDRASAYAKAISEVLPETMQIADRFHLHENLLDAVKEAMKRVVPNEISVPNDYGFPMADGKVQESEKNDDTNEVLPFHSEDTEYNPEQSSLYLQETQTGHNKKK